MTLRPRLPRLRLLPVTIFVAAAMLSVRVGHLWHDVSLAIGAPTEAQPPAAAPAAKRAATKVAGDKMAPEAGAKDDKVPAPPAGKVAAEPARFGAEGPALTEKEIAVLEKLSQRRDALDAREREIDLRANLLAATEKRIEAKLGELKKIQAEIASLLKKHDSEQQAKLKNLIKMYENMKPKEAAAIFEKLDLAIVLDVIEGMRVQKSGAVLAQMDPSRAEKVTAALAQRRQLPKMP
jgi:flagellar motility protein MotE (MotC chaperone)